MIGNLLTPPDSDILQRTRWYVRVRWCMLLSIVAPSLLAEFIGQGWSGEIRRDLLFSLAALASNGIFFGLTRLSSAPSYQRKLAASLLALDVLLVTLLIFLKGGTESRSAILYVIPILMSSALFGRLALYATALASVLLYDGLIFADYYNVIHSIGALTTLRSQMPYTISTVTFFSSVLIIIATLADFINNLLVVKERQASASATALERAQAIARLGSWEWNIAENKLCWSDELYRLFGLSPETFTVTYANYLQCVHPEDQELVTSKIESALASVKSFKFDHRIVLPDGSVRYLHCEGEMTLDKAGMPASLYGICHDITDERALDRAKNEFVSLASHQLRTPASGVKAFLSLLAEGYAGPLSLQQQHFLDRAYQANERQLQIVSDLLNVANVESGRVHIRKKPVDLGELVQRIAGEHVPQSATRQHTLTVEVPARPIMAAADTRYLQMVIDNLLSNASKYTPEGGKISVKLSRRQGNAVIRVSDTGVGISRADMDKLFQKFSRLDNDRTAQVEGSGLGLYLAKNLVKLHRGSLNVSSQPGRGSTFTVRLPVVTAKSSPKPPSPAPGRSAKTAAAG